MASAPHGQTARERNQNSLWWAPEPAPLNLRLRARRSRAEHLQQRADGAQGEARANRARRHSRVRSEAGFGAGDARSTIRNGAEERSGDESSMRPPGGMSAKGMEAISVMRGSLSYLAPVFLGSEPWQNAGTMHLSLA